MILSFQAVLIVRRAPNALCAFLMMDVGRTASYMGTINVRVSFIAV